MLLCCIGFERAIVPNGGDSDVPKHFITCPSSPAPIFRDFQRYVTETTTTWIDLGDETTTGIAGTNITTGKIFPSA